MKALQPLEFVKDDPLPVGGVSVDPVTALLIKARALIANGWIRYVGYHRDHLLRDHYCSIGAIGAAEGWDGKSPCNFSVTARMAIERLAKTVGDGPTQLMDTAVVSRWNDHQACVEAVLAGFDKAIAQI